MKNLLKAAILVMFLSVAQTSLAKDISPKSTTNGAETMDAAQAQKLISRLEEIKAMDKSSMTRSEKKALRKEVNSIQKTMDGGVVYISAGAIILIIVLLIILL